MAASAISCLIQVLNPVIQNEVGLLWGVDKEMKRLSSTFSTILAVLDDAEIKQFQQRAIQDWLHKLKDAAYQVRDILDDCKTETSRWKYQEGQSCASLRKVWTCYPVQNLLFRHNIGNRVKDVLANLDAISQERIKFHLNERISENLIELDERRETSSALTQLEVFGREADKNYIVRVLMEDIRNIEEVSVYPIIGMGGLGKTTLAQIVVNDGMIRSHFEPIIWVYVSTNFNVKRVMKLIIESVSKNTFEESSLDSCQKKVREILSGKRYMLVLDDVWNEDQEEWDKLKYALSNGLPGACILVTTRSDKVASVVRAIPTIHLSVLSEDDCWLLFRQRAFELHKDERPDLVAIGKEIVKKCGGVPLAAKALGGLMRTKMGVKQWVSIKESDMWDLPQGEVPILPALRLSYYNLPLELRNCFSYCAVFPKGSRMEKDKVIQLWMANGFISSRGNLEVEDVGNEFWSELYKRSLFLDDDKGMFMHDLVYDLARSIIEDEFHMMEVGSSSIISKQKIRHVTLVNSGNRSSAFPEALGGQKQLHSILLQDRRLLHTKKDSGLYGGNFSCDFKNFSSLRVFDANGAKMTRLSMSIGYSRHLTYLNLSRTNIMELPASICSLHHLQTINLNWCLELRRLPKRMHCLTSLRHLCLTRCCKIENMPPKIGKLIRLKTLSTFVVGDSDSQRVGELHHLDLGGHLELRHLERVQNSMEAKEAKLAEKPNLCALQMKWDHNYSGVKESILQEEEEVIEALKPHPNIKNLSVEGYRGKELPSWMSDPSGLRNVDWIVIEECRNCLGLPALWHLPCLKRLQVVGMGSEMEYMFQNSNNLSGPGSTTSARPFLSLEELIIGKIPNLKGFLSMEDEEEGTVQQQLLLFPRLRKMFIWGCPQLVALPTLPAIEELAIFHSSSFTLLASISKLTSLTSLVLYGNEDMVSLPEEMLQNLTLLQTLRIHYFSALKVLPENMSSLESLQKLEIMGCEELECLPDGGIGSLRPLLSLEEPTIGKIPNLKGFLSMEDEEEGTLQQLLLFPRLRKMKIWGCPQLVALPTLPAIEELVILDSSSVTLLASISKLTTLTSLKLDMNEDMASLPEEMLQNLTLLQSLKIDAFRSLKVLPENMSSLVALKELIITDCQELEGLPDGGIGSLRSLQNMEIRRCRKIVSLPDSIQTLTQLQHFYIQNPSPELSRRCEEGKGQDWHKISHISQQMSSN